jgi:hypothetical protein
MRDFLTPIQPTSVNDVVIEDEISPNQTYYISSMGGNQSTVTLPAWRNTVGDLLGKLPKSHGPDQTRHLILGTRVLNLKEQLVKQASYSILVTDTTLISFIQDRLEERCIEYKERNELGNASFRQLQQGRRTPKEIKDVCRFLDGDSLCARTLNLEPDFLQGVIDRISLLSQLQNPSIFPENSQQQKQTLLQIMNTLADIKGSTLPTQRLQALGRLGKEMGRKKISLGKALSHYESECAAEMRLRAIWRVMSVLGAPDTQWELHHQRYPCLTIQVFSQKQWLCSISLTQGGGLGSRRGIITISGLSPGDEEIVALNQAESKVLNELFEKSHDLFEKGRSISISTSVPEKL